VEEKQGEVVTGEASGKGGDVGGEEDEEEEGGRLEEEERWAIGGGGGEVGDWRKTGGRGWRRRLKRSTLPTRAMAPAPRRQGC